MGKREVSEYLLMLRMTGEHEYLRYAEIHEGMRQNGKCYNYTSVWRSVNSLFSDGLLEVRFEGGVLQRTALFRAPLPSSVQVSHMKRLHNILLQQEEKPRSENKGEGVSLG